MSDNHDDLEKMAMALYIYAAELIKEGKSQQEIIDILIQRGVSRESAETIMSRLDESRDNVTRRSGYLSIVFGAIIVMISLFPLFGVIVDKVEGFSVIIAFLLMFAGIVIAGRGLLKVFIS